MSTHHILLTGGAGYIGARLTPHLLAQGWSVTVLDRLLFGEEPLSACAGHPGFRLARHDIRDTAAVREVLSRGRFDTVIHLAAMSNDPSAELDPTFTREVNLDAVSALVHSAKELGVGRFLYASSASVYGIKATPDVTEDLPLEPITLYARYKAEGEEILRGLVGDDFVGVSVRAATVCGWSPRLRLDLTVNILTEHAVRTGVIKVFGGDQMRPNVHVDDLVDFYTTLVDAPAEVVQGKAYNVSRENATVLELANLVRVTLDRDVAIEIVPTQDHRSYHLSGARALRELGWQPRRAISEAIEAVAAALVDGRVPDSAASTYRNVVFLRERPHLTAIGPGRAP